MENKIELLEHAEFLREHAGKILRYQTEQDGDTFSATFEFSIDGATCRDWHCDVTLMRRDGSKNTEARMLSDSVSIDVAGDVATLMVSSLPLVPFEILIRPYGVGADGLYRYGTTYIFYYQGALDGEGKPCFSTIPREDCRVLASESTYIFNEVGFEETDFSEQLLLQMRNPGDDQSPLYRAAYFKFTLDPASVKALDTVSSAKLRFFVSHAEDNPARKFYDLTVHGVDADWSAPMLNYRNFRAVAADRALIAEGIHCKSGSFKVDVLDYLRAQKRNEDGSLTVAFRVTNEGHEDALVVFLSSVKKAFSCPVIELGYYNVVEYNLATARNDGFEPWGYAKMLVDEWFDDLRDKIYPRDEAGNLLYHDELGKLDPYGYAKEEPMGDFTHPIDWKHGSRWLGNGGIVGDDAWKKAKYVRTMDGLGCASGKPYSESEYAKKTYERDTYGGIVGTAIKGKATGFFHIEKHGVRTYVIDPLGNPYFAIGVNTVCLGDDQNLKDYSLEKYGDRETYFKEITASLKEMGITINHLGENLELLKQEDGLVNVVGISVVGAYMRTMGRQQVSEGVYPHNNTINLFDPDFVKCSHEVVGARIRDGGFAEMDRLFGYTTDNEQPSGLD
ncbi:MAG: DNRLRE domain-containing protein, partial [Clostridia bacterium]|nr:DNRLRE domain-containing protein [Clostridia bacterium]